MESEYFLLFECLTKYIPQVFNIFIYFIFAYFVSNGNIHKKFMLKFMLFLRIYLNRGFQLEPAEGRKH